MPISTADYIKRVIDLEKVTHQKSCFLFGPRQTGKSALVEHQLKNSQVIDLLDEEIYLVLLKSSKALQTMIQDREKLVVIDEIQLVPKLLNEVHRLIEKEGYRFLLTGSSARKLRKRGVNLLGGRARSRTLHPLVSIELGARLELNRALSFGSLPSIYFSDSPAEDLRSYIHNYLKEEIVMEAVTRNIPDFSRFLEVAAQLNGQLIHYEKVANLAQVKRNTVQNYYQILRDTLIARDLEALPGQAGPKRVKSGKFYFFDVGVVNALKNDWRFGIHSSEFGFAFEAFLYHELSSYIDYQGVGELHYWRTITHQEVDFILNREVAIEVKATKQVQSSDLSGLRSFRNHCKPKACYLVCRESRARKEDGISILPVEDFLKRLWSGEIENSKSLV